MPKVAEQKVVLEYKVSEFNNLKSELSDLLIKYSGGDDDYNKKRYPESTALRDVKLA